jgi:large subunit ribosomal protein L30
MADKKIKIRLTKSVIHSKPQHRKTVKALGLHKIDSEVIHNSNLAILGMVRSIRHLVVVEEIQ